MRFRIRGQLIIQVVDANVDHLAVIILVLGRIELISPHQNLLLTLLTADVETEHALLLAMLWRDSLCLDLFATGLATLSLLRYLTFTAIAVKISHAGNKKRLEGLTLALNDI